MGEVFSHKPFIHRVPSAHALQVPLYDFLIIHVWKHV